MGLFNGYLKEGPGVREDEPKKKAFFAFLDIYIKRFWKLIQINLLYFICCIPIITIGPATAGFTCVLRNYARDTHSFIYSDFFEGVKKNWKQGFVVSLIQAFMLSSFFFGISQYNQENVFSVIYFIVSMSVNIIFAIMMFYVYPMMVTFKLTIKQLMKNALIFVRLGFKTNVITLILSIIFICGPLALIVIFPNFFPMILIAFALIILATLGLIINFNVYPYLKKYIIDPYYKDHPEELKKNEAEPIFSDGESGVDNGEI